MHSSARPAVAKYPSGSSTSSTCSVSSIASSLASVPCTDSRPVASVAVLHCLRCHRQVEATTTDDLASTGMVRVGFNLYYCKTCAVAVGYKVRCLGQQDDGRS